MTEQIFVSQVGYPPDIIKLGDIRETWCDRHMVRTQHLYTANGKVCLECHPEKKPEEEKKNG